ncbi:MAG TPA: MauE/DoxX family redox-associated membrane protein [Puia sp.]|nr:MauE/DoxX family redox-associated membrane protein [Puia sp.]
MKPLIVLLIAGLLSAGIAKLTTGDYHTTLAANIGMCSMLLFTALGHFKFTRGMVAMIPGPVPFKKPLVHATGIAEIALGLALLFPATRQTAAIALIVLFCLMLPANIYAAMNHINYETGETNGKGLGYLWFRIPLQLFFIAWIGYFSL